MRRENEEGVLTKHLIHGLMSYYQNANFRCSYEITIKHNPIFSQFFEKWGLIIQEKGSNNEKDNNFGKYIYDYLCE